MTTPRSGPVVRALASLLLLAPLASVATESAHDGSHDFDFDFGTWKTHSSRLLHPLTGSHDWVPFQESVNSTTGEPISTIRKRSTGGPCWCAFPSGR
jgi:hypothetical protein